MNIQRLETLNSEKLLQENYWEILGAAVCLDYRKHLSHSLFYYRWYSHVTDAEWTDKITGETFPSESSIFITYIRHEPVGIYEQIISWSVQTFNKWIFKLYFLLSVIIQYDILSYICIIQKYCWHYILDCYVGLETLISISLR